MRRKTREEFVSKHITQLPTPQFASQSGYQILLRSTCENRSWYLLLRNELRPQDRSLQRQPILNMGLHPDYVVNSLSLFFFFSSFKKKKILLV